MSDFLTRLRMVREHLDVSARSLSTQLGLSRGAWLLYEKGQVEPGMRAFLGLTSLGISVDWVLTGEGSMCIAPQSTKYKVPDISTLATEIAKSLQGHLLLMGADKIPSLETSKFKLMELLCSRYPEPVSQADLLSATNLTEEQLNAVMATLNGLVISEGTSYNAIAAQTTALADSEKERRILAQTGAEFLMNDVLTQLGQRPSKTVLLMGGARVEGGVRYLETILRQVNDPPTVSGEAQETVHFVFGAVIK